MYTGIVYKIVHKDDEEEKAIYVGSTRQSLSDRFCKHKYTSFIKPNIKWFVYVHENGGWNNFSIREIEIMKFDDVADLRKCEQKYIDLLKTEILNSFDAQRSVETREDYMKLYYNENKKQLCDYKKTWHSENKEKISNKAKKYYEEHKEHLKLCNKINYKHNKIMKRVLAECIMEICCYS